VGAADGALRFARRTSEDPARAASRWKALTGRKAVGCLPLFIPEEILHAAGMLPVTVWGDEYGDSPPSWEVLDGWVFPPVPGLPAEPERFLTEMASGQPQVSLRFTPRSMKVPSTEETLDQVERLREWAGEISGRPASDGALSKSISIFNENRGFISLLEGRLAASPGAYSALEVFWLLRSAMALPREAHTLLLRAALSRDPAPARHFRARLFLGGRMAPRPVMEAIDSAGGVLVGDDLDAGHRNNEAMADERGDPLLSLSRRLRAQILGKTETEVEPSWAVRVLTRIEASGADRFLYLATGSAAFPEEAGKLAAEAGKRGIPFLSLELDSSSRFSEREKEKVSSFIASSG